MYKVAKYGLIILTLLSNCSDCLLISWVTRIWSLMGLIHKNPAEICYIQNINYVLISNKTIFFQFISLILIFKALLLQLVLDLCIQFIFNNMIKNLLPQLWLENTNGFHMNFLHHPAECINYLILFSLYVLDFKIKLT